MWTDKGEVTVHQRAGVGEQIVELYWISDANGDAVLYDLPLRGTLLRCVTSPLSGPTDNYDVTLKDRDGYDALAGLGTDRDTATVEQQWVGGPIATTASHAGQPVSGLYRFAVSGAGTAESGKVILYLQ